MTSGLELIQLRKLTWLARCVYLELLAMADQVTGRIETSYAVLIALLDFDLEPTAHTLARPTVRGIRTAVEALESLDLVSVDRIANEKRHGLFFQVQSRAGLSASANKSNRLSNRVKEPASPRRSKGKP